MLEKSNPATSQPHQVQTTRLDVAAFLLVRGFKVSRVDLKGTTATFAFEDPDFLADGVVREFYNNGQVSAGEYSAAQKRVRDLMWEARRAVS